MARPLWLTLCSEKTPEGQGPQAARHNGIRRVAAGPWAVSDQHTPRMFGSTDPHSCRKSQTLAMACALGGRSRLPKVANVRQACRGGLVRSVLPGRVRHVEARLHGQAVTERARLDE